MRIGGSAPSGQRGRVAWTGGAVVLGGVLQFLQKGVEAFHLSSGVLWLITALIVVAGLGIDRWRQRDAARAAAHDFDAALDEALACWPPRPVRALTAYDVGVHPHLDLPLQEAPYVQRDADAALDEGVREERMVVVFGPPGAGKSRSAFEAVRRHAADAILLMPEDAKGLKTLVAQAPASVLEGSDRAVLWLEGLDQYLDGLDVDALMRFLRWADSSSIVLVATIREDALDRLLQDPAREGFVIRRLLSHGRGVFVGGELGDHELAAFERLYGRKLDGRRVVGAFPQNWRAGWSRCASAPAAPQRARQRAIDGPTALLAPLFVILAIALFVVGEKYGWTVAPPLDVQIGRLAENVRPCQSLREFPPGGKGIKEANNPTGRILVAIVSGVECLESDEVRFYKVGPDDRLDQLASLRPALAAPRFSFDCIGPGPDPCHATLRGASRYIVGAFRDSDNQQELPVVAWFGSEGLRLRTLSLPERRVPPLNQRVVTLRLRSATGSSAAAMSGQCRESRGCLEGRTAQTVAVVPRSDRNPVVVLTGYTADGTPEAPEALRARAWKLEFSDDEPQRGRDCLVLVRGRPRTLRIRIPSLAAARNALLEQWRPRGGDVMC